MSSFAHNAKVAVVSFAFGAAAVGMIAIQGYRSADHKASLQEQAPAKELSAPYTSAARDEFGLVHSSTLYALDNGTTVSMYTVHNYLDSVSVTHKGKMVNLTIDGNDIKVTRYTSGN